MRTKKGTQLADALDPNREALGLVHVNVLSKICRLAKTHGRIQEIHCNEELSEIRVQWIEKREAQIEARIRELAKLIPGVRCVKFGGDPRDYTVKLVMTDGRYNTWGGSEDGIGVPQ